MSSYLLELLNGSLIDTTALVNQVTGRGRFAGVDMTNDNNINMSFFLSHVSMCISTP